MSFAYMPIYTGDYLRDTRHLTPLKHGIYYLALMHCWDSKGPMPIDEQECAGICNCRSADEVEALRYIIDRYFIRMDDGHYNKRMADEVVRFEQIAKARSGGGLRGAEVRRDKARQGAKAKNEHKFNLSSTQAEHKLNLSATQVELKSVSLSLSPSLSQSLPQTLPPIPGGAPPDPPSAPSTGLRSGKPAQKRAAKPVAPTTEVWLAYSQAYGEQYGVDPVRNARVNAQMVQLVGRLGADEAPGVARAYVSNRNGLYVASKHCTDLLLRDAEKLRTEWATGQTVTQTQANHADKTQTNANVFGPMLAEARAKEAMEKQDAERTIN